MAPLFPQTSQTLLGRIASGDQIGWAEFYDKYGPVVVAMAKYKGIGDDAAQDIIQEVMMSFFDHGKNFVFRPEIAKFRTYFSQIVRVEIANYFRKQGKLPTVSLDAPAKPSGTCPEALVDNSDEEQKFMDEWRKALLREAYGKLRERIEPETWQAFELYFLQGRPVRAVAKYLEYTVNHVYQAKRRCCIILRDIINELNKLDSELKLEIKDE